MPAFFTSAPGVVAVLGVIALVVSGRRRAASSPGGMNVAPGTATMAMQMVLSLVVLTAALYVILAKPNAPDDHKWAYSIIGTILGYWLRTAT